jgi:hypothetical protein
MLVRQERELPGECRVHERLAIDRFVGNDVDPEHEVEPEHGRADRIAWLTIGAS